MLMGLALHLSGVGSWLEQIEIVGILRVPAFLYAAVLIAFAGWMINVRLITALAIAPFAQMLDTSSSYFHAAYVFYSPESTLTILQMSVLIVGCVWATLRVSERHSRHLRVMGTMAFVVANMCALVGSLWGDKVGENVWGPGRWWHQTGAFSDYSEWSVARDAFEAQTLVISGEVYSVLWAIALVALIYWFAHRAQRGLFNTAVTFAALHAYTQMFESFGNEPLAYVIGGFSAIPLAWVMLRLNQNLSTRN